MRRLVLLFLLTPLMLPGASRPARLCGGQHKKAGSQEARPSVTVDPSDKTKGAFGQLPKETVFEVKSYAVQASTATNSTRPMPVAYTIFFLSDKNAKGAGRCWMRQHAADVTALTGLMDGAWARGRKVLYNNKTHQLAIGIETMELESPK